MSQRCRFIGERSEAGGSHALKSKSYRNTVGGHSLIDLLLLALPLTALLGGCAGTPYQQTAPALGEAAAELLTVSLLTVNLQGIHQGYGDDHATWQQRYGRIGEWMRVSGRVPAIIALQELYAESGDLARYETLAVLLSSLAQSTGVSYRIAYFVVRPVPQGLRPVLWAGNALLYDPDRLSNRVVGPSTFTVRNYNDESAIGVHPRRSMPCAVSSIVPTDICSRLDGDGVAWVSSYRDQDNRWIVGPAFAMLEPRNAPGSYVHVYNLHVQYSWNTSDTYVTHTTDLLKEMEQRLEKNRLYPPLVLGDFNIGPSDILSSFSSFEIASYSPDRDVVGVLKGRQSAYPSKQEAHSQGLVAPKDIEDSRVQGQSACGEVGTLWSDHCAVYVVIRPIP